MSTSTTPKKKTVLVLDTPEGFRIEHIAPPEGSKRRHAGKLLLALAGVAALVLFGHGGRQQHAAIAAGNTDQIIVKFKSNASTSAINALNASNAVQQVDAIPALGLKVFKVPTGKSADTVVAAYKKNPNVQFAEVNSLVKPEAIPNDPNFGSAWHLSKIQAPQAWDSAKATGVLIGICDTGVASVADLTPVLRSDLGWNAVDGSTNWSDSVGHGTVVAGAAAATTNNQAGVAGVAWGAQIIPVRISNLSDGSATIADAAKCVSYAADRGARVINVSYNGMAGSVTIDSAATYAQSKGALTTVAAGNNGLDPAWSSFSSIFAVAATDKNDARPTWSNYGAFVDIAAPGSNIWTTYMDGTYWTASGTSLSAPVAAGGAALVFGANPGLTPAQVRSILTSTADDIGAPGPDVYFGAGRLNVMRAVNSALSTAPIVTSTPVVTATATPTSTRTPSPTITSTAIPTSTQPVAPTATPTTGDTTPPVVSISKPVQNEKVKGNATITATASDNIRVTKVEFYLDGALVKTSTTAPYTTTWNTRKSTNGAHTITSKAYDASGNSSEDIHTVTVTN